MKRSALLPIVYIAVSALTLPVSASAQMKGNGVPQDGGVTEGAPAVLEALELSGEVDIRLDGRIDEAIWQTATPITDFTQQLPVEGAVPSEDTEIRVLFDADNLYIGAIVYDDPDGVLAFQRERDAGLNTDDRFMWILDTFQDGRTGYFFEINAAGLMGDGILRSGGGGGGGRGGRGGGGFGGGGSNKAWDGIWEARTTMRPDGWSAEIRIPFRTLNFNPEQDTWGINFQRTIRRRNEEILWRGYRRSEGLFNPIYAGELTGLRNMSQGIGLEAVPSTVASWKNIPTQTDQTTYPSDISLDVNYSITSSLRASVSLNTDFAEIESDQRRVNLTRFSLRFPERRGFFLEGSNVFSFAPSSQVSPFYSRQIGLGSGQQIPIKYGGRTTGQVGAFELGFYQIHTGQVDFLDSNSLPDMVPTEDFTVARVKRQIFEQSSFGAIYTRRSTSADLGGFTPEVAHTAGVDFNFNTRYFLGNKNLQLETFWVWNSNIDPTRTRVNAPTEALTNMDLSARGFRFNFPNDVWSGHLSYRELGEAYDPEVGFVTRRNFRRVEPQIRFAPRPDISWLRNLNFSAQFRNQTQLGTGLLEEREWQFTPLGVSLESGDGFNMSATHTREYLDRDFTLGGVDILTGDYRNWTYRINGNTTGRRRVSFFGGYNWGGFWDGEQTGYNARVTVRPNPGISVSTNYNHNVVTLPRGEFTVDAYEIEGQWNPSPWVASTLQFQYDDESEELGLFARIRWIVTPGSDLFLVYTHNWQNLGTNILDDRDLIRLSRGASIKLNYTYRF